MWGHLAGLEGGPGVPGRKPAIGVALLCLYFGLLLLLLLYGGHDRVAGGGCLGCHLGHALLHGSRLGYLSGGCLSGGWEGLAGLGLGS